MNRTTRMQQIAAWLCGAGIILCFLGYRGIKHLPLTPEEERQEEAIRTVVRQMGAQAENEVIDQLHSVRLQLDPSRERPYRWPGTIALMLGIVSTLGGMVLWFRNTTASQRHRWVRDNDDA